MQVTGENLTTTTNPALGIEISDAEIRSSAALVINALTGSSKSGETMKHERLSEDLILAATAHAQLKKIDSDLADRLIKRIKPNYNKHLKQKNNQPIFRAVDDILKTATTSNKQKGKTAKITQEQKKQVLSFAFDKAQLDAKNSKLKRKVTELPKTVGENSTNIDRTLEKVISNKLSDKNNLVKFRKRINAKPKLTPKQVKRQRKLLGEIDPKNLPEEAKPVPNTKPDTKVEVPPSTKSEIPSYEDIKTTPETFSLYPEKKDSPVMEVVLPAFYSQEADGIALFRDKYAEQPLLELAFSHFDDKSRSHWKADRTGKEFPDSMLMKIHFRDGTHLTRLIDSAANFESESYSF